MPLVRLESGASSSQVEHPTTELGEVDATLIIVVGQLGWTFSCLFQYMTLYGKSIIETARKMKRN